MAEVQLEADAKAAGAGGRPLTQKSESLWQDALPAPRSQSRRRLGLVDYPFTGSDSLFWPRGSRSGPMRSRYSSINTMCRNGSFRCFRA